jgi:hypothetical protein
LEGDPIRFGENGSVWLTIGIQHPMADFSFVQYKCERRDLTVAYKCITENNLWEWYRDPANPPQGCFNYCDSPEAKVVFGALIDAGCNGSALPLTLRTMQYIAKNGLECYKRERMAAMRKQMCRKCSRLVVDEWLTQYIDHPLCTC